MTPEEYRDQLRQLLPTGLAWPSSQGAVLHQVLLALADEFSRVELRAGDLLRDANPSETVDLLADFERVLGLPDPCLEAPPETQADRRAELLWRLNLEGHVTPQFIVDLGARLGFAVQVDENLSPTSFRVNEGKVGEPLAGSEARFLFDVHAPVETVKPFRVDESTVGERIETFGNEVLECAVARIKPAHTEAKFIYDL